MDAALNRLPWDAIDDVSYGFTLFLIVAGAIAIPTIIIVGLIRCAGVGG